jgi:hypothetical protein
MAASVGAGVAVESVSTAAISSDSNGGNGVTATIPGDGPHPTSTIPHKSQIQFFICFYPRPYMVISK